MPTMTNTGFVKHATTLGSYYTTTLSKTATKHFLRGCATTHFKTASETRTWWERDGELRKFLANHNVGAFKQASIGGDQEQGFEQAFASLAYTYIKDKSPRLLDFIVGFQLVDRNEDSTKAIGIFGFKVGEQWLYAPVFFLNGDMKGHELLYIKNQDAFVPMKENWVNSLISRKTHQLGESSSKNTHQLGGLMPNLSKFRHMPSGTKYGSDGESLMRPQLAEWTNGFMPIVGAIATQSSAVFAKHASLGEALDLRNFLSDFPLLKMAFEKAYMKYPGVKQGFDKFYGKNFFYEMGTKIKQAEDSLIKRSRSFILPPAEAMKKLKQKSDSLIPEPEKQAHPLSDGRLRVHRLADYMKAAAEDSAENPGGFKANAPELTEEQRKKLLNDTVLIDDKRDPSEISTAYNTQVAVELTNPTETSLYNVLEKPGKFDEMLVIHQAHSGRGRENFDVVIRKSAPRNWLNIHPTNVWVNQAKPLEKSDFTKYVDGLGGSDSLATGGTYVAVHANGSGTCPFTVREDYGDGCYRVEWKDYCRYNQQRPAGLPPLSHPGSAMDDDYSSWDAKIWINKRQGSSLRSVRGELMIPEDFKIVKIQEPKKPKKDDDDDSMSIMPCCSSSEVEAGSAEQPIMPGNLVDIQTMLHEKTASVQIHDLGANEVVLKSRHGSQRMNKLAALISLVTHHGLAKGQARSMLKEAAKLHCHNRIAKYYVKYASPWQPQQGPNAPAFPEAWTGTEQNGYNSVNSIYPQEEFLPVEGMSSQMTDPSIYDPFFEPDQGAMQVAQQAANSGQKEVFDASMISGMLKSVSQDNLVNKHLGDLMKALDKLGRILFMFYWHQEEFEDRYGKQDLPELEDSLRNSFEVLGDVVLWLKEKTVGGGQGLDMASVGRQKGEPSIQEAARN